MCIIYKYIHKMWHALFVFKTLAVTIANLILVSIFAFVPLDFILYFSTLRHRSKCTSLTPKSRWLSCLSSALKNLPQSRGPPSVCRMPVWPMKIENASCIYYPRLCGGTLQYLSIRFMRIDMISEYGARSYKPVFLTEAS